MPLIYNLNIVENIALIKEVHEYMPISKAQALANDYLSKINLAHIAQHRVEKCSALEIFYVIFIRAIMTEDKNIIIKNPYLMIKSYHKFHEVLEAINTLDAKKHILILDLQNNEIHYKGSQCNMIK